MLCTAAECGEAVPAMVDANCIPPAEGEDGFNREEDYLSDYGVSFDIDNYDCRFF